MLQEPEQLVLFFTSIHSQHSLLDFKGQLPLASMDYKQEIIRKRVDMGLFHAIKSIR
jgi:hypothetical protein